MLFYSELNEVNVKKEEQLVLIKDEYLLKLPKLSNSIIGLSSAGFQQIVSSCLTKSHFQSEQPTELNS